MADPYETTTLIDALNDAAGRGFTEHFTVTRGRLRAGQSGALFGSDQVTICGYNRFEGVSDPDDMSILYAIKTRSGVRGTLADAYGTYSDPSVAAFMDDVAFAGRTPL
jgi:hypothetical protein